jgi:hypothetical protein
MLHRGPTRSKDAVIKTKTTFLLPAVPIIALLMSVLESPNQAPAFRTCGRIWNPQSVPHRSWYIYLVPQVVLAASLAQPAEAQVLVQVVPPLVEEAVLLVPPVEEQVVLQPAEEVESLVGAVRAVAVALPAAA